MADIFADALMLATKIFTVMAILYGLWFVVMVVVAVVDRAYDKARTKKEKEVDSDDV